MRRSLTLLLSVLAVVACREPATRRGVSLGVDDFGDTIVAGVPPERIVSLNPTTTELLFAIGAGARVVGRTHWDEWPDSAKLVPDLGDGLQPNVEAVLGVHPSLVLLYASADNRMAARALRRAGIVTISLKIDRIEDFQRAVRLIGQVVGDSARAQSVADSVARTLDRVRAATAGLPTPSVFWPVNEVPLIAIGGRSYLSQLLSIAGARNVYDDIASPSPQVSLEDVIRRDPDVVLAGETDTKRLPHQRTWRALRAVREGHVYAADPVIMGRPSVQMGHAARQLALILHPGLVIP